MNIRRAHPADAATISRLGAETFHETFAADNRPEDMAAYLAATYNEPRQRQELENPALTTLLVEADGEAIAFAQLRREEQAVEIVRFYVRAAWHGRGVARALMDAVEAAAAALGARRMWLGVWEHNVRAIRFYEKCGFRLTGGSLPFLLGSDLQTDHVMSRDL